MNNVPEEEEKGEPAEQGWIEYGVGMIGTIFWTILKPVVWIKNLFVGREDGTPGLTGIEFRR